MIFDYVYEKFPRRTFYVVQLLRFPSVIEFQNFCINVIDVAPTCCRGHFKHTILLLVKQSGKRKRVCQFRYVGKDKIKFGQFWKN